MIRRMAVLAALVLTACGTASSPSDALTVSAPPPPGLDPTSVELGRALYEANYAECHGVDLAGADDWQTPLPSGGYRPPPHDSTGHTWHHPDRVLIEIVTDPSSYGSAMPPTHLGADELRAVLDYLKSNWGAEERRFQWERTFVDLQG